MKPIYATPEIIKKIFSETERYMIPDFQRPYSWEEDQCTQLWDDLINFFESKFESRDDKSSEQYFLGSIVVSRETDYSQGTWDVIDGQQRLTTLLLLLKALYHYNRSYTVLDKNVTWAINCAYISRVAVSPRKFFINSYCVKADLAL